MKKEYDVAVIGGGPAGMASALAADREGASVILLEKDKALGGRLNQCIHNGYGQSIFNKDLTGTEYANKLIELINNSCVEYLLNTEVTEISLDKKISCINFGKRFQINAKSIVLSTGCREKAFDYLIDKKGIYTAGQAQRIINLEGKKIGENAVVLGSDDLALIVARRLIYEGAKVLCVVEPAPYPSASIKNISYCLSDYGIPLCLNSHIQSIEGEEKVEGVHIVTDTKNGQKKEFIPCDTLIVSMGLQPQYELLDKLNIEKENLTNTAVIDQKRQTSIEGFFLTGDALIIHSSIADITFEGEVAGKNAALYAKEQSESKNSISVEVESSDLIEYALSHNNIISVKVKSSNLIEYALPQRINTLDHKVKIYFRVKKTLRDARLDIFSQDELIYAKKFVVISPEELVEAEVNIQGVKGNLTISMEA
ncbi:MAG: FAD-dependent oxidoreductase [Bacillota bacterium]|jgi:thioredoxin reductase|nr:FAD-dependent oxidoreductase [Bacillota bacterium]HHU43782.1 FAD-dependent oxidoreductase [Clostridiales bacterium]